MDLHIERFRPDFEARYHLSFAIIILIETGIAVHYALRKKMNIVEISPGSEKR